MNKKTFLLKAFSILTVLFIVLTITGCSSAGEELTPLNGYSDKGNLQDYIIIYPMAYIAHFFGNLFGGYLVVGIIFLTIIVRALGWPLYAGNANVEVKQLEAKPELDKLAMKYADKLDQESQRMKMMEQMAINKKHGINPFKSCLALPIQLALFSSMLEVLRRLPLEGGSLSLKNDTLFGISLSASVFSSDFSLDSRILCGILALITGVTSYIHLTLTQKRMKRTNLEQPADPMADQMASVMKTMFIVQPIMIASFAAANGAMGFYYLVGNAFSIIQTIIMNKKRDKALEEFKNRDKNVVEIID